MKYTGSSATGTTYPYAGSLNFDIYFEDPCLSPSPTSFTAPAWQINPPDYYYTGTATFTLTPFTSDPAGCLSLATYACSNTGTSIDFCGAAGATFDAGTGAYTFSDDRMWLYPAATY